MQPKPSSQAEALPKEKVTHLLGNDGPFSVYLKGYEFRPEQIKMLEDVLDAYNHNKVALIEAGTGTGKSLAYLVTAMLWAVHQKQRTLISTHTIALQEQLLKKDIPLIKKALNLEVKTVLVKGMGNYVCLRKLDEATIEKQFLNPDERQELEDIQEWAATTKDGSRSTLPMLPSSTNWERVCAENDTCSKRKCPHFNDCFFFKERKQAEDAQIFIGNHHLLFADIASGNAILPEYQHLIIDEAHHIEDVATKYFSLQSSRIDMLRIIGRLAAEKGKSAAGKLPLLKQKILDTFPKGDLPPVLEQVVNKITHDHQPLRHDILKQIVNTFDSFSNFTSHFIPEESKENKLRLLPAHQTNPLWTQEILPQVHELLVVMRKYIQLLDGIEEDIKQVDEPDFLAKTDGIRTEITGLVNRLTQHAKLFSQFTSSEFPVNRVRWIEQFLRGATPNTRLYDAELDLANAFVENLFNHYSSTVLCSATLTTNQNFQFIKERLGLTSSELEKSISEGIYDSPFDYQSQATLIIPTAMPHPNLGSFKKAAIDAMWETVKGTKGGVFILFTSYTMLRECYEALYDRLVEGGFPPLKQGEMSRHKLLEAFKATKNAVLFGTDSFWEGVDVVGNALRCVVITKLPFKVPSEPIIQARAEAISKEGGDPFFDYALPLAIVKFKQGFGRLIRHKQDTGHIVCLDSRLLTKPYGKRFLNSLPKLKILTPG